MNCACSAVGVGPTGSWARDGWIGSSIMTLFSAARASRPRTWPTLAAIDSHSSTVHAADSGRAFMLLLPLAVKRAVYGH